MKFILTGDTHRSETCARINYIKSIHPNTNFSLIILGDSCINYFLDERDQQHKTELEKCEINIYCVRGNHEQRPELVDNIIQVYDPTVNGCIYFEKKYPHIRYFIDGEVYIINNKSVLVLGGAYSVDKYYRLATGAKWFEQEQLNEEERKKIFEKISGQHFDIILSHTCPFSMRPTDLFLSMIDQSTVDNSMEIWLETLRNYITYNTWVWGHYHDDRIQEPEHYMLFRHFVDIEDIYNNTTDLKPKEEK